MEYRSFKMVVNLIIVFYLSCVPPAHMRGERNNDYSNLSPKRQRIIRTAKRYIGVKYKFGGKSLFGFDCSGFVMHVYQKHRIYLPRSANKQYIKGRKMRIQDAEPGDLVFFDIDGRGISHVGIYLGNLRFIHAPSTGKEISYATIDNPYWKERFIGAASFLK